jgi:phosphoribosylformylglycinamidine cyclo-ligase
MNYKDSGVDIEAGDAFVERLREKAPSIGGFNGMYRIPEGYEKPVMVSGADGVGTKINMAQVSGTWNTIGIDLVAMCVNDVITCGAKPLYFLDYISTVKLDDRIDPIMEGIIKGCELAGIDLLGGETAEHGRFAKDYDLAGFCTGVVEEEKIIDGKDIKQGDMIIGIGSTGLHSNGYSLINDMLWRHKIKWADTPELLEPTEIYSGLVEKIVKNIPIKGMAHITGGGIPGNLPRCFPEGLKPHIDWNSWTLPEIFKKVQLAGEIPEEEMKRVYNMGIGYCLVVPPDAVEDTQYIIRAYDSCVHTTSAWLIGEVVVS